MKNALVLASLVVATSFTSAFAGGSVSRESALEVVCAESAALCKSLTALNISAQGVAVRLGNHLPDGGSRILPMAFTANNHETIVTIDRDSEDKIFITIQ